MTAEEQLVELRALIRACNASRRFVMDEWGNETAGFQSFYLIPRGAWDELVKAAEREDPK